MPSYFPYIIEKNIQWLILFSTRFSIEKCIFKYSRFMLLQKAIKVCTT